MMQACMVGFRQHHQVLRPVIGSVPVDVVHVFGRQHHAADLFLGDKHRAKNVTALVRAGMVALQDQCSTVSVVSNPAAPIMVSGADLEFLGQEAVAEHVAAPVSALGPRRRLAAAALARRSERLELALLLLGAMTPTTARVARFQIGRNDAHCGAAITHARPGGVSALATVTAKNDKSSEAIAGYICEHPPIISSEAA